MFFSGIDSQLMSKSGQPLKQQKNKIFINERYLMKKILQRGETYNIYEGIDLIGQRFVNIYVKQLSQENTFTKQIKQELKNKISPPTLWSGIHKIEKSTYMVEVHEKFGPTMKQMFQLLNKQISQKDFIHLFYQMLKLVQKIGSGGFVHRQLSPSTIVFDSNPQKNELYVLNTFTLKKKNEQCGKLSTRYCSKGSHLGLNANVKDDLESLCYIMIDIYSNGKFMRGQSKQQYETLKGSFDPRSICDNLPSVFLDFYYNVMGMNYTDEINYFHWKNLVLKTISRDLINRPFSWMMSSSNYKDDSYINKQNYSKQQQRNEKISDEQLNRQQISQQLVEKLVSEQKENIEEKVSRYTMESKANSMKSKLKLTHTQQ